MDDVSETNQVEETNSQAVQAEDVKGTNQVTEDVEKNTQGEELNTDDYVIPIKYNKEAKTFNLKDEMERNTAIEYIQKGMNYDHIKEDLDSLKGDAGLAYLDELTKKYNFSSRSDLVDYLREQDTMQQAKNEALEYGIDNDEYIKKVIKDRKDAERFRKSEAERINNEKIKEAQKAKRDKDYDDFLEYFKAENGRDVDVNKDIPSEVFDNARKGMSLKEAYIDYQYKELKKSIDIQKKNDENAKSSPGSASGDSSTDNNFISQAEFEKNKNNRSWVVKNLSTIMSSRKKW